MELEIAQKEKIIPTLALGGAHAKVHYSRETILKHFFDASFHHCFVPHILISSCCDAAGSAPSGDVNFDQRDAETMRRFIKIYSNTAERKAD